MLLTITLDGNTATTTDTETIEKFLRLVGENLSTDLALVLSGEMTKINEIVRGN